MFRYRGFACVLAVLIACLLFFAVGQPAMAKPVVLKYAGNFPATHHMTRMMNDFAKLVEQRTNGQVKIQVYPAGQLYSDKDLDQALSSGAVDLGEAMANVLAGMVPAAHILDFAMLWDDWDHYDRVWHNGGFKILDDALRQKNMVEVYIMPYGKTLGPILREKKVVTHNDLKGLKIRSMGGNMALATQAIGATPVFMSSGEVYTALQRGTIDGAVSGWTSMYKRGWGEVSKYLWELNYCPTTCGHTVANLDSWNRLSPEVQKIMRDTGRELEIKYRTEVIDKADEAARNGLIKQGVQIVVPTKEEVVTCRKLVKPIHEEWAAKDKYCEEIFALAEKERR